MRPELTSHPVVPRLRPAHATLDPAQWWAVVGPLSAASTIPFSDWMDTALARLEESFSEFSTTRSFVASLGR